MAWKNLTFILIPHSQSTIKQYKVSRVVLIGVAAVFLLAIGVMIFYIIGFQSKSFLLSSSREIEHQNAILEEVAVQLDYSVTTLTTKLDSLEAMAETTRREADISDIDLKLNRDDSQLDEETGAPRSLNKIITDVTYTDLRSLAFSRNFDAIYAVCMDNSTFMRRLPSIRPALGTITKEFSYLEEGDVMSLSDKSHPGVDITNVEGTPVVATADGVVRTVGFSDDLGRYIEIDHQNGYRTRYTHLMQRGITLKEGDSVQRGLVIGLMGRTGIAIQAVAPHLLYSVEHNGAYVDPADYFFASDVIEDSEITVAELQ